MTKRAVRSKIRVIGLQRGEVMNVSLTPDLENLVKEKVQTGQYPNAAAVVEEALQLLRQRDAA